MYKVFSKIISVKFFLFVLFITTVYSQSSTYSTTLDLDGSSSFIEVPTSTDLRFDSDKFTLEAWIKIENGPASGSKDYIFRKRDDWSLSVKNINGSLYLEGRFRRDYHGNWPDIVSSQTISTGTWYHIAFTNSVSNGRMRIYINGSIDKTQSWSSGGYGLTSWNNPVGVGASIWNGSNNPTDFFEGEISDVRFWDSERTQSEINTNKNATLSTNSNLKLYFKINEGLGSTVNDFSGNSINGTLYGSYQWKTTDTISPTVTLTDTDSDNIVSNSDVVTITATFSVSMAATPTLSLSGIVTNTEMTATDSASVWTYAWTVSTTVTSTTATVSGTDLSGNTYAGTDSITFTIDNILPTVTLTESDSDNILAHSDVVTFTANFSESMALSPTISINEVDQALDFYIGDYSSNQIGLNVQNGRFDNLTRNSNNLVGYTFEVISTGVTYTLTEMNSQSQSWVYFETSPEYTPSSSSGGGTTPVVLKGKTLVNNSNMSPVSGNNSNTNWNYSYTTSSVLNKINVKVSGQDLAGNSYSGTESITLGVDNVNPLLDSFSFSSSDYIINSSETVTFTAIFSEEMTPSPKLNINGISSLNYSEVVSMIYISTNSSNGQSTWKYGWSPPTSLTAGTVSISITGFDLVGNPYNAGVENVTVLKHKRLIIDKIKPTVSLTSTSSYTAVAQSSNVTITAQFSEPMTISPTISIAGQVSNSSMSLVSTNSIIRKEASLNISDYGYNMIAVGSNDWDTILGSSSSSDDLLNYYLEINGVNYQITEIKIGDQSTSDYWWYFETSPEYTPGYSFGGTERFVIKSPNYQTELSNWQYSWTVSSTSSSPTVSVLGTDLAGNTVSGTTSLNFTLDNQRPFIISSTISNSLGQGQISATETNTIIVEFNEIIDENSFNVSDLTILPNGIFTLTENNSSNGKIFDGYLTSNGNYSGIVTFTLADGVVNDLAGNFNTASSTTFQFDNVGPTVSLSSSDNDNIASASTSVTITATFSEAMSVTPTISITGIGSNLDMSLGSNNKIWTYILSTTSSTSSITATVSGTDLLGNPYAGSESLTISIDNTPYQLSASSISQNNLNISLTFSEELFTDFLNGSGVNSLTVSDFSISQQGGSGSVLTSSNPSNISKSGNTYDLSIPLSGYATGTETLTISIAENNIYDAAGNSTALTKDFSLNNNLLIEYDITNTNSYNGQPTSSTNKIVNDLSGNGYNGEIVGTSDIYYDSNENALFFNGNEEKDGKGLAISGLNYISGDSDMIEELTIFARIKVPSTVISRGGSDDQRILFSFDRSSVFRFSIGSDFNQSAKGKLAFHFTNSDATFDTHAENTNDLRDNQWHNVAVTFKANQAGGLKYYIDGNLVYTHSGSFAPISNQSTNETPRFGYVGNGNEAPSFKGNTGPDDLFYGHIQKIKYYNKVLSASQLNGLDTNPPTVNLTDNIISNNVKGSDTVRIISTFNEAMSASPKISISGQVSNSTMAASSTSVWYYDWDVPSSFNGQVTATVTGTDLAGNGYSGTESITYKIDNLNPTLVSFNDNITDNYVNNNTNINLIATFSESMASTPTLSISGLVTNTSMTVSASTNSTTWTYQWDVPLGSDGSYFATVSGTDLSGNSFTGTDSLTYAIDNSVPILESVTVTDTNSKILLSYSEPIQLYDSSYFVSNFSLTKIGGTATVSYTGYSFSTTDSNTIILNIVVTGEPTGEELIEVGPSGVSTLIDRAGNYALDYSNSNQTSNTVYLTNTPPKFASTTVNSSNTRITIVFSEDVTADASGTELSKTDFTLAVNNGTAILISATPTAISKTDSKTYVLSTYYSISADGSEILTVIPISSVLYDSKGTKINISKIQSNTVQLNDQAPPTITGTNIDSQNQYVDIAFSEGVYATASPTTAVTSSSFILSQQSGPSYEMIISSITTKAGANLSGGEKILRFNLGSVFKPTGREIFAITATNSSSVVDIIGNSMSVSQTNNTFELKPPTSGGVSFEKSTIAVVPSKIIANGINTAVISVQAKDSVGQNFLEGGYQVTVFGPNGDLVTKDNQDGTYSASYTPETILSPEQENLFGYSVAQSQSPNQAILKLYKDVDGDGVYDINDQCPGTKEGLIVDEKGCALSQLDRDNDGVFDDIDQCPDTPEFEINNVPGTPTYGQELPTVVDEFGCGSSQRDTDGDGIVDMEDNCIEDANPDQADTDGDGIGDVCDTNNPLPEVITTSIIFVQQPVNGSVIGTIEATDPDGEVLVFSQEEDDEFSGILSIDTSGNITVNTGAILSYTSNYNGASLSFIVSDGKNEVKSSVKIVIEDAPLPPEISIITLEISEDAEVGTIAGFVEAKDPMGGQILSISLQGDGFIELVDGVLKTTQELDYETTTAHAFTITAQASDRSDGPGLSGSKPESLRVLDIPNTTFTGRFFISIFNVDNETLGAKVDFRRYFNPHNKNVGKWKIKKKISGGADADKFTIKTRSKTEQKNDDPIEDENEDYLDFITPPDYENPGDDNGDNIYEVEVDYVNTEDGAPEVPIVVTQTNIQVPEGSTTTIELQSQPVLPTDDNDGDGVPDIIDNSPLVANAEQTDEDGDGVGDVSDDFDHDGVWNPFDTCPNTLLGEIVDSNGCLIYYIPSSNFSISKTEKCAGTNSINIEVVDSSITYNVSVSGAVTLSDSFSSSSWSLDNLSAGVYSICISVEGVSLVEFERCFEVTISEPDPLIVNSMFNKNNQTITFGLNGGVSYDITHNGITTQTTKSSYRVSLDKGLNRISISTGIECQGLFENTYLKSYEVKYAPNPFSNELTFTIGGEDRVFSLEVYTPSGQLIDQKVITLPFGIRYYSLQTDNYNQGVYFISVKGFTLDQSFQVIKE